MVRLNGHLERTVRVSDLIQDPKCPFCGSELPPAWKQKKVKRVICVHCNSKIKIIRK